LGFSFSNASSLRLEINTTNQQITSIAGVTLTTPLTAGRYARLVIAGSITAGGLTAASSSTFTFTVGTTFVSVSGGVTVNLMAGATQVLRLTGTANWVVSNTGIAGRISMSVAAGVPASLNFSLAGTFTFELNTTRSTVSSLGGLTFNPALPDRLNPTDATPNAWAKIAVSGAALNVMGLAVNGGLEIAFSSAAELRMRVINATGAMTVGGLNVASGTANATFLIRSDGIAGKVTLTAATQPDANLFFTWQTGTTFDAEINTTPGSITVPFGATTATIAAGPFAQITATGGIVAQNLTLTGAFGLSVSGTEIAVAGTNLRANLQAGTQTVFSLGPISAAMVIRNTGFAAQLAMNLAAGPDAAILGFSFTAATNLRLEINTTNQQITSIGGVALPTALTAGRYARLVITGNIVAGGLTSNATFTFLAGGTFVAVSGTVTTSIGPVGGGAVLVLQGGVNWVVSGTGIAGRTVMTALANVTQPTLNAAIAGTFTFEINTTRTTITSVGGQTFSPALPDRLNPTDASSNAWARIAVDGSITFRVGSIDAFRVTGTLNLAISSNSLQIRVNGSANGVPGGPQFPAGVTLTGVLTAEPTGVWGLIEAAAGALAGTGFNISGYSALAINTLPAVAASSRNVTRKVLDLNQPNFPQVNQTVTLPGGTAFLFVAGRLTMNQVAGSTTSEGFGANGNFEIRVSGGNFSMSGASRVDLEFLGTLSATFNVTIDTTDVAGSRAGIFGTLRLGGGGSLTVPGAGFDIDGYLSLEFNTTSEARTVNNARPEFSGFQVVDPGGVPNYNQPVTIAANTVRLFVGGELQLKQGAGIDSFALRGGFELTLLSTGIRLQGNAQLIVPLFDDLFASLDLQITSSGIVSTISLGSTAGSTSATEINRTGIGIDARFRLEVNTTGGNGSVSRIRTDPTTGAIVTVSGVIQTDTINIAAHTVRLVGAGLLRLRDGVGSSETASFVVTGRYVLSISGDELSVDALGFINLGRIQSGFTLEVDQVFTISSAGVVAALSLGGSSRYGAGGEGYSFDARFRLEINTTTNEETLSRPAVDRNTGVVSGTTSVTIPERTIRVAASGSLQLGSNSLFTIHGYFVMTFSTGGLSVAIDARLKFLNTFQLDVDGAAGIFTGSDPGIAMDIDLSLNGSFEPLLDKGYFSTHAGMRLRVNTRDATETFAVPVNVVRVRINGDFEADGFDFDGAFNFTASGTRWVASLDISVDIFGFIEVSVSGSVGFDTDRNTPNDTLSLSGSAG
ncbi:MAG TPA: hypothetical protein VFD22_10655, partial [Gemmatimonadaceae bacterium]|nr:hypothetical protein [Gemmatimonadaceae bacterium]